MVMGSEPLSPDFASPSLVGDDMFAVVVVVVVAIAVQGMKQVLLQHEQLATVEKTLASSRTRKKTQASQQCGKKWRQSPLRC